MGVSVGRLGEKIEGLEFSIWEWLPTLKDEISRLTKNWEACLRDPGALSSCLSNKTKLALIGARTREKSRFYQRDLTGGGSLREAPFHPPLM